MIDPNFELLSTVVFRALERLEKDADDASAWSELAEARAAVKDEDEDLELAVELRDLDTLRTVADEWLANQRHLPVPDREVLKKAMKAYRKSLKVTRLDEESKIGVNPMTKGAESSIVGIEPPRRYPKAVWEELVRQGRLVADRWGTYELPPGG